MKVFCCPLSNIVTQRGTRYQRFPRRIYGRKLWSDSGEHISQRCIAWIEFEKPPHLHSLLRHCTTPQCRGRAHPIRRIVAEVIAGYCLRSMYFLSLECNLQFTVFILTFPSISPCVGFPPATIIPSKHSVLHVFIVTVFFIPPPPYFSSSPFSFTFLLV